MTFRLIVPAEPGSIQRLASLFESNPQLANIVHVEIDAAPATASERALDVEPRLPRIRWVKHGKGKTGKRHWSAAWQGLRLRVEKVATKDKGIVFDGFIDDGFKFRAKAMASCRSHIETMAHDLAR